MNETKIQIIEAAAHLMKLCTKLDAAVHAIDPTKERIPCSYVVLEHIRDSDSLTARLNKLTQQAEVRGSVAAKLTESEREAFGLVPKPAPVSDGFGQP